jgi:two-component system OmpR family sensor kinase
VEPTPGGGATFWVELQGTDLAPEQQVQPDQVRALTVSSADEPPRGATPES